MKRGQVTIFIVIAIIIVAVGVVIYFYKQAGDDKIRLTSSDAVQTYILDCVQDVSQASLESIGIQGGFYDSPEMFFDLEWAFIPYYYYEGQDLMPSKETIQTELQKYVDDNLKSCLDSFTSDYKLKYDKSNTKVTIKEEEVMFEINLPISIVKGKETVNLELKDHPVSRPSVLSDIIEVARFMTDENLKDPKIICVTCISDLLEEKNLYLDELDFVDTTMLIVISENSTSPDGYAFEYLNKYTGEEVLNVPKVPKP